MTDDWASDWKQYALTVGELRFKLEAVPDDTPVILEKDAEGNGYSPLSSASLRYGYEPDSGYSGEVHELDPDDEDDRREGLTPCLLLGPVN